MKNQTLVHDWLRRAKSNLARARLGRVSKDILYEDLCFDCQQAVEKGLKALLVRLSIIFPRTHSITRLVELVEENGIDVPQEVKESIVLTEYAVSTRYPGDYEPIDEAEFKEAFIIAENVILWIEKILAATE
jgi:HEPN domain-containing protein